MCCGNDNDRQRAITRLCAQSAMLVMRHGAETALVEQIAVRTGLALGMDSVEVLISAGGIVVTTLSGGYCVTTTRRNIDGGINMGVVTEVQRILIRIEQEKLSPAAAQELLSSVRPHHYPHSLVAPMIGISCGCFSLLAGADYAGALIACLSGGIAMALRLCIAALQYNPLLNFCIAAFVATTLAGFACARHMTHTPEVALASCVLFLVPGFPLINSVADMLKGYTNTGIARWVIATLLTVSTCIGITAATILWGIHGWM